MASSPTPQAVASLFTDLLGRAVTTAKCPPFVPGAADLRTTGIYVGEDADSIWVCTADLALTTYAGAALVMLPAEAAKQAVVSRKLDDSMQENFIEVLNICSQLFTAAAGKRVRLSDSSVGKGPAPAPPGAARPTPAWRLDLTVKIAGYGDGRMSLMQY